MSRLKLNAGGAVGAGLGILAIIFLKYWWFNNGPFTIIVPTILIVFPLGVAGNFIWSVVEITYFSCTGQLMTEEEYEAKENQPSFMSSTRREERQETLKRIRERGIGGGD